MPVFRLTRNGNPLIERTLESQVPEAPILDVAELQPYGFEIDEAEDDTSYLVTLGDEVVDDPEGENRVGQRRRRTVLWDDRPWFESARGFVSLRVLSRASEAEGPWSERLRLLLYARPTKISESQYRGMANSLTGLSAGLLFDVVGKAGGRVGLKGDSALAPIRPPHLELQAIEGLWSDIQEALDLVCRHPVMRVTRRAELGQCWGAERLLPTALSQLAARGVDPRHPVAARPFVGFQNLWTPA